MLKKVLKEVLKKVNLTQKSKFSLIKVLKKVLKIVLIKVLKKKMLKENRIAPKSGKIFC